MASFLPSPPLPRLSAYGENLESLLEPTKQALADMLGKEAKSRQDSWETSTALQAVVTTARQHQSNGRLALAREALGRAHAIVDGIEASSEGGALAGAPDRPGQLSGLLEDMVGLQCFLHFFESGGLLSRAECRACVEDGEYLGGAISFASDLGQYAVGRSMAGDAASVARAKQLVDALNGALMAFDFRNGPLRFVRWGGGGLRSL